MKYILAIPIFIGASVLALPANAGSQFAARNGYSPASISTEQLAHNSEQNAQTLPTNIFCARYCATHGGCDQVSFSGSGFKKASTVFCKDGTSKEFETPAHGLSKRYIYSKRGDRRSRSKKKKCSKSNQSQKPNSNHKNDSTDTTDDDEPSNGSTTEGTNRKSNEKESNTDNENITTDQPSYGNNNQPDENYTNTDDQTAGDVQSEEPSVQNGAFIPESQFKNIMLKAHNDARALHGSPPVQWSDKIVAWGKTKLTCEYGHTKDHYDAGYAENIGYDTRWDPYGWVFNGWYGSELKGYPFSSPKYIDGQGHMTVVIWRETTHIGCVIRKCGRKNSYMCNYNPPGNFGGRDDYAANVKPATGGSGGYN